MNELLAAITGCHVLIGSTIDLIRFELLEYFLPSISGKEGGVLSDFDSSIEGMNTREFSVGIFYFLVACIIVFTIFVFMYMFKDKSSKLKKGEKIMFVWLLFGVVVAVAFGAAQMLHGYLF